jgi:hypothetical protein
MADTKTGDAKFTIVQNGAAVIVRTKGTITRRQASDIVDHVEMIAGIKLASGRGFDRA